MKPSGAGAVMADKAPAVVETDSEQVALWRRHEFFPTPPWAGRAGGELIKRLDPLARSCWEPACGQGHLAYALADYFPGGVLATDIVDQGKGRSFPVGASFLHDFLDPDFALPCGVDWIVTNPPFGAGAEFVRLGLKRARRGVAILARAAWFESAERYPLFFGQTPLAAYAPFFERVPMTLGRWEPKGSTATAYAWFVWTTQAAVWTEAFGDRSPISCRVEPIPPGTRERLTHRDDARLYGAMGPAPLFGEDGDA